MFYIFSMDYSVQFICLYIKWTSLNWRNCLGIKNICISDFVQQIIMLKRIWKDGIKGICNRNTVQKTVWELKHSIKRYCLIWRGVWGGKSWVSDQAISLPIYYIKRILGHLSLVQVSLMLPYRVQIGPRGTSRILLR
jgi:hypothetical protein